jgi:hypothetical protein
MKRPIESILGRLEVLAVRAATFILLIIILTKLIRHELGF